MTGMTRVVVAAYRRGYRVTDSGHLICSNRCKWQVGVKIQTLIGTVVRWFNAAGSNG